MEEKPNPKPLLHMIRKVLTAAILLLPVVQSKGAKVTFAKIFTDHCVLQRQIPVPIWGWTVPGSKVEVEFGGKKKNDDIR